MCRSLFFLLLSKYSLYSAKWFNTVDFSMAMECFSLFIYRLIIVLNTVFVCFVRPKVLSMLFFLKYSLSLPSAKCIKLLFSVDFVYYKIIWYILACTRNWYIFCLDSVCLRCLCASLSLATRSRWIRKLIYYTKWLIEAHGSCL